MNPTVEQRQALRPLSDLGELIRPELNRVEQLLRDNAVNDRQEVSELLAVGLRLGGKRLRPMLLLLAARAVGNITSQHHLLGCVIEMIHTATLVHDDVLDSADLRRHQPTVNSTWGNHSSVLLGDYLFSRAFFLASTLDSTLACQTIGRATNRVCEGEIMQVAAKGNLRLDEQQYLDIIRSKTGELCSCAAELGARYAGANDNTVGALGRYGMHLGVAFQIADDVLDLVGNDKTTGKTLGTDLDQLKMTLPLIWALCNCSTQDRRYWSEKLSHGAKSRLQIADWLNSEGAIDHACSVAAEFSQLAISELQNCDLGPGGDALVQLAQFVVNREM